MVRVKHSVYVGEVAKHVTLWHQQHAVFGCVDAAFLAVGITSLGLSELLTDFCSLGHNLSASVNSGLSVGAPQRGWWNTMAVCLVEKGTRADIKIKRLKFLCLGFSQRTQTQTGSGSKKRKEMCSAQLRGNFPCRGNRYPGKVSCFKHVKDKSRSAGETAAPP